MQVNTVLSELIKISGKMSGRAVAVELGHAPSWFSVVSSSKRSPALATVADVADVCGYDLVVINRKTGERLGTIVAPRHLSKENQDA